MPSWRQNSAQASDSITRPSNFFVPQSMEGLLDRASPRRGSLTSLHRYSSGSFSHNSKQSSPSNTLQFNNSNLYALCKDLDKFSRHFIIKAVQVIVQSRLNGSQKIKTDCKPSGNDWFNLNIADIAEVSDKTKSVLDTEGLSVKANWRVCCEISLRTNDGSRIVLEHWIISNKANFNSNQKPNSDLAFYNRMSLLLKTILTTAHIVPAYRLASRSLQTDSCRICYRVYALPRHTSTTRGSSDDISSHSESPNRRSLTSTSSIGSIDIREFVSSDELDHFCPIMRLGSIKTEINELDVSLCYRTDTRCTSYPLRSPQMRGIIDEDCLVAAKQLLAGNGCLKEEARQKNQVKNGSSNSLDNDKYAFLELPLRPAFASSENDVESIKSERPTGSDCTLIESAFERLLPKQTHTSSRKEDEIVTITNETSAPKSLSDSYVFVNLSPPFASDEQNDMNSFFHGPTPTFANGLGSLKDVEDLTSQLATIEANASQIDEFVDNICISEDDEIE